MKQAFIGIDCGTTSIKCMAVDVNARQLAIASRVNVTLSPHPGWMEQDPKGWIEPVMEVLREVVEGIPQYRVAGIALCGHMSSPVFLNKSFEPLMNCVTVGDSRCARQVRHLQENFEGVFKRDTMNIPRSYAVAPKILWYKENCPDLYNETKIILFAKDYIRFCLTGFIATDPSDAGNTLLLNPMTAQWNWELIKRIGLRCDIFPPIVQSTAECGKLLPQIAQRCGLPAGVPVFCGGADMACSQIGTGCVTENTISMTLSTSGQVCMRIRKPHPAGYGKLTFHPGVTPGLMYAMGSVFSGGLAVNWCYQLLHNTGKMTKEDFKLLDSLAEKAADYPPGGSGITFLPFLTGSGSPYFSDIDRAAFLGLASSTKPEAVLSGVFEGVAYHLRENAEVFLEMGCRPETFHIGGGGTKMPVWVQMIADVLGQELRVLKCTDASTLGAALLAVMGTGAGTLEDLLQKAITVRETVQPRMDYTKRHEILYGIYKQFYRAAHLLEEKKQTFFTQEANI